MENFDELLLQAIKNMEDLLNNPEALPGITTGFAELDSSLGGFNNSDLIVVGSRPAMGKTSLLVNMALRQSVENHIPVLFYTFEKTNNQIIRIILSSISEISGYNISKGRLTPEEWLTLMDTIKKLIEDVPLYIIDKPSEKIQQFCKEVKNDIANTGAKIVYIDYLQLFSSSLGYQNRYEEISACTRELKHLAKELNIPIVIASQINRNPEYRESRYLGNDRPHMYDLRDSGTICEDSNIVLLLERPDLKYPSGQDHNGNDIRGLVEVIVAKNHMGREDVARLRFKPEFAKFEDWKDTEQSEQSSVNYNNSKTSETPF